MTVDPDVLVQRLRQWSELSAQPLTVPPDGPPDEHEIRARLKEACALWVTTARLEDLGRHPVAIAQGGTLPDLETPPRRSFVPDR